MKRSNSLVNLSLLIFVFIISGCNQNLESEKRLKELEEQNKELREQINTRDRPSSNNTEYKPAPPIQNTKFIFVVLQVLQTNPDKPWDHDNKINMVVCSPIQEVTNLDDNIKYQLMDKSQDSYLNYSGGKLYGGSVKSRKCLDYDNYEEASKAREKYLNN